MRNSKFNVKDLLRGVNNTGMGKKVLRKNTQKR